MVYHIDHQCDLAGTTTNFTSICHQFVECFLIIAVDDYDFAENLSSQMCDSLVDVADP